MAGRHKRRSRGRVQGQGAGRSDSQSGGVALLEAETRSRELDLREQQERRMAVETAVNAVAEDSFFNGQRVVNRAEWLPVGFGFNSLLGGALSTSLSDHDDGRNAPFVLNDNDIAEGRAMARFVTTVNCPAIGIGEILKNYVVGRGFVHAVGYKKKFAGQFEGLDHEVQEVLDEFDEDNSFKGDLDRELFWRSRRDGEAILGLWPTQAGRTKARVIEPEFLCDPGRNPFSHEELKDIFARYRLPMRFNNELTNWTFGVHTPEADIDEVLGLCLRWQGDSQYDYLPEPYVWHLKGNKERNFKRGMSDFYPAWKWLIQQSEILENTGSAAKKQSAIAYIVQHISGVTKQKVESVKDAAADYTYETQTAGGGTKTIRGSTHPPGTELNVPKGQAYVPGPTGSERGNAFMEVIQGILRQVATRFQLTEGAISGDDSSNTFACHDNETECLTEEGWVTYDLLRPDLKIATVSPKTNKVEFQRPRSIHIHNYAGPMVHFHGKNQLDVMVTPNHKMWITKAQHARVGGRSGKATLTGKLHPFRLLSAVDLVGKASRYYMQFGGEPADGEKPEVFTVACEQRPLKLTEEEAAEIRSLQGVVSQNKIASRFKVSRATVQNIHSGRLWGPLKIGRRGDLTVNIRDWLEFLGYWLAEGWTCEYARKRGGLTYSVGLCQNEGVEADQIAAVLSRLGFNVHRSERLPENNTSKFHATKTHYQWSWSDKGLCRWLRNQCGMGSHGKKIPAEIKRLDASLLMILLDAMIAGDGSELQAGSRAYFTVSRQLADDVQEIAVRCGYVATIQPPGRGETNHKYIVKLKPVNARRRGFNPKRNVSLHEYVGPGWCCTVDNGLMITRRGGKPAVTGNSSVVAGSRFHKCATAHQGTLMTAFKQLNWKVVRNAYNAGRFRKWGFMPGRISFEYLKKVLEINSEAPDVDERAALDISQERQILLQNRIMSRKTWMEKATLDAEVEEANIKKEAEEDAAARAAQGGGFGGGAPGGGNPLAGMLGGGAQAGPPQGPPSAESAPAIPAPPLLPAPERLAAPGLEQMSALVERMESAARMIAESSKAVQSQVIEPAAVLEAAPSLATQVRAAAMLTDTNPTPEQKESGRYPQGIVSIQGMLISIENPWGSTRSGKDASGREWRSVMAADYGEFLLGGKGSDGDKVDVFIGPNPESEIVFVVDQIDQLTGEFDENKVLLGYHTKAEAVEAYRCSFSDGWKVGKVVAKTIDEFREWLTSRRDYGEAAPGNTVAFHGLTVLLDGRGGAISDATSGVRCGRLMGVSSSLFRGTDQDHASVVESLAAGSRKRVAEQAGEASQTKILQGLDDVCKLVAGKLTQPINIHVDAPAAPVVNITNEMPASPEAPVVNVTNEMAVMPAPVVNIANEMAVMPAPDVRVVNEVASPAPVVNVTNEVSPTPVTVNNQIDVEVPKTEVTVQGIKGDKGDSGEAGARGERGDKGEPSEVHVTVEAAPEPPKPTTATITHADGTESTIDLS